jgi:tetratricopeptide (TPR) repeat protein
LEEAIAEYREAIRLKEDYAVAHVNLGNALKVKGRIWEAMAAYREAIRLEKDSSEAHNNLGNALKQNGLLDEAIAEYREAIRLKKDGPLAYNNLGIALKDKGLLDEAIAEHREAIRLQKDYAQAHTNLGVALKDKGLLDEAIAEHREAIRLQNDCADAYCNLGRALVEQERFGQAVEAIQKGHQLDSRNPRWPYPSAEWLRQAQQLAALEPRLPTLLMGQAQPADTAERLTLAFFCQEHKKLYAAAARWYAEAFSAKPKLADDLLAGHRYNAACAAALAGCGQGKDAATLDEAKKATWRRQALEWLRADPRQWAKRVESGPPQSRQEVQQTLTHWKDDSDLAGVRGEPALAKLPEAERPAWRKLWADVEAVLREKNAN